MAVSKCLDYSLLYRQGTLFERIDAEKTDEEESNPLLTRLRPSGN